MRKAFLTKIISSRCVDQFLCNESKQRVKKRAKSKNNNNNKNNMNPWGKKKRTITYLTVYYFYFSGKYEQKLRPMSECCKTESTESALIVLKALNLRDLRADRKK